MELQRFNFTSRDCPICYRLGSLHGELRSGATLECAGTARDRGCFRSFIYETPKTLARLDTSRPAEHRCACGSLVGFSFDRCNPCAEQERIEARTYGRAA